MINAVQVVKPITSANLASGVAFDAFGTSLAAAKHIETHSFMESVR
jgi:homoserine kinase